MKNRTSHVGGLLFLVSLIIGCILVVSGFLFTAPTGNGFYFPDFAAVVEHPTLGLGRNAPDVTGTAQVVPAEPLLTQVETAISEIPTTANTALDQDHWFIEMYGVAQSLFGRTFVDDIVPKYSVIRLTDGSLVFANQDELDVSQNGTNLVRLRDWLDTKDIPLVYLQAPQKIQSDDDRLPAGVVDYGNDYADQVLAVLEEEGVYYLDFRETLAEIDTVSWSDWFFDTDHHWTADAAFVAHQAITDLLRTEFEYDIPSYYTDPDYFMREVYTDLLLGSQGRRVGSAYGGIDDIPVWQPTFFTNFTYNIDGGTTVRTGAMVDTLLFMDALEVSDVYTQDAYGVYAGSDYAMTQITNHENPDGPRVLLVRDSFARPVTPFFALSCSELITMDMRYFSGGIASYVNWLKPDIVMVLYTAGTASLDALYDFLPTTTTPSTAYLQESPLVNLARPWEDLPGGFDKGISKNPA